MQDYILQKYDKRMTDNCLFWDFVHHREMIRIWAIHFLFLTLYNTTLYPSITSCGRSFCFTDTVYFLRGAFGEIRQCHVTGLKKMNKTTYTYLQQAVKTIQDDPPKLKLMPD